MSQVFTETWNASLNQSFHEKAQDDPWPTCKQCGQPATKYHLLIQTREQTIQGDYICETFPDCVVTCTDV